MDSSGYLFLRREELHTTYPRGLCVIFVSVFPSGGKINTIRKTFSHPILISAVCELHRLFYFSIRIRPSAFGRALSFYLLASIPITLYCAILHSDILVSKLVCFASDHCCCFVFRPISLPFFPFSLFPGCGSVGPPHPATHRARLNQPVSH